MTKFILLGATGALGGAIKDLLPGEVILPTRGEIDFTNLETIDKYFAFNKFQDFYVVNCIAYMPADKCELNPEISHQINVTAPLAIAQNLNKRESGRLIHFSSDFVFGTEKETGYSDSDLPNPLNVYGFHKAICEDQLSQFKEFVKIIRFSGLIARTQKKSTFLEKIKNQIDQNIPIKVINDVFSAYSSNSLISEAVSNVFSHENYISHVVSSNSASWHQLASFYIREKLTNSCPISELKVEELQLPATRNKRGVLKPSAWVENLNSYSNWEEMVSDFHNLSEII